MIPLLALLAAFAAQADGWQAVGPERGHVLDASAAGEVVLVATRVGVLRSGPELSGWERDTRFPRDTRRVAALPDGGAWATPGVSLWLVAKESRSLGDLPAGSLAVDLVAAGDGGGVVAVRGEAAGVLRVEPTGAITTTLDGVDPWVLATRGDDVWVGTVDDGLWSSDDGGRSFDHTERGGQVSALGLVGGHLLVGWADGRLVDQDAGEVLLQAAGAIVTGIADDDGTPVLTLAGEHGPTGPLALLAHGQLQGIPLTGLGLDEGLVRPTGAWSVPSHGALIGTFRQGPLRVQGGALGTARSGFLATVTGGAAIDESGRLLLALMGTGTYLSTDGGASWAQQSGHDAPVTDAIGVVSLGRGLAALDFEGLSMLDAAGHWQRLATPAHPQAGRRNGLAAVAPGGRGTLWGLDVGGQLWRYADDQWLKCPEQGGVQLDGDGSQAHLLGPKSVLLLTDCAAPAEAIWASAPTAQTDWSRARAAGDWLALLGSLWLRGARVAELPPSRITAIAARGDEALVGLESGEVLACTPSACTLAGPRLPGDPAAVGWLPDGRVWVAERRGTLLVAGGTTTVAPWFTSTEGHQPEGALLRLEAPPWLPEGAPGQGAPGVSAPPAGPRGGGPGGSPPGGPPAAEAPRAPEAEAAPGPRRFPWLPLGIGSMAAIVLLVVGAWRWAQRSRTRSQ